MYRTFVVRARAYRCDDEQFPNAGRRRAADLAKLAFVVAHMLDSLAHGAVLRRPPGCRSLSEGRGGTCDSGPSGSLTPRLQRVGDFPEFASIAVNRTPILVGP